VAVLVAGALTGCQAAPDGGSPGAADRPRLAVPARPVVSAAESAQVLDAYARAYNGARDARAWRDRTTGPLAAMTEGELRDNGGRPPRRRPISLANPVMYVPRSAVFPKWFVVAALERRGRAERPVVLMFTQAGADAAGGWRLADRLYLTAGLPKIATDAQGYAVPVDPRATGLAMAPAALPAAQAGFLDHGDQQQIVPGDLAGRWRAAQGRQAKDLRAHRVSVTARPAPTSYPVSALRTGDGGALVWSALVRTVTYAATGRTTRATVPADVRGHLRGATGRTVTATWLWRTVTYVPVRGRARVLIQSIDLTSARAS
jgi:hypothetical protein